MRDTAQEIYYLRLKGGDNPKASDVIDEADAIYSGVEKKFAKELAEEKKKAKERRKKMKELANQAVDVLGSNGSRGIGDYMSPQQPLGAVEYAEDEEE